MAAGDSSEARACDSRSATTMANSPRVIRGRTARLIGLQNTRRQGVGLPGCRESNRLGPPENYEGCLAIVVEDWTDAKSKRVGLALGLQPVRAHPDIHHKGNPQF